MCNYFSCIVTRDLKVHWSKRTCSHEDIVAELKLTDVKLVDRDFVRIEVTPNNKEKLTRYQADWTYHVDEESTIPAWYKKAEKTIQEVIWTSWSDSVKTQLVIGEESADVMDTYLLVQNCSSTVVARGSSTVEAWDSSNVVAHDSSKVVAHDSSTVEAWGSSNVIAHDSSKVVAHDSSNVIAHDSSKVIAWDSSNVIAWDSSTVVAWDSSNVIAHDSSKVEAWDSSTVEAWGSSTVVAWDSSKVEIKSEHAVALTPASCVKTA
jgi:hypothetical protein